MKKQHALPPKARKALLAAALLIVALAVWCNAAAEGTFSIDEALPDNAMLRRIITHKDELLADARFTLSDNYDGDQTLIYQEGNVRCALLFTPEAAALLADPFYGPLVASGGYYRNTVSDFVDIALPWNPCFLSMGAIYSDCSLDVTATDADAIGPWPLAQFTDAVTEVLGTP